MQQNQIETAYFDDKLLIVDNQDEAIILGIRDVVSAGLVSTGIDKLKADKVSEDFSLLLKSEESLSRRNEYIANRIQEYSALFEFKEPGNPLTVFLNAILVQDDHQEFEAAKKLFDL